jgi:hypothetical protein
MKGFEVRRRDAPSSYGAGQGEKRRVRMEGYSAIVLNKKLALYSASINFDAPFKALLDHFWVSTHSMNFI